MCRLPHCRCLKIIVHTFPFASKRRSSARSILPPETRECVIYVNETCHRMGFPHFTLFTHLAGGRGKFHFDSTIKVRKKCDGNRLLIRSTSWARALTERRRRRSTWDTSASWGMRKRIFRGFFFGHLFLHNLTHDDDIDPSPLCELSLKLWLYLRFFSEWISYVSGMMKYSRDIWKVFTFLKKSFWRYNTISWVISNNRLCADTSCRDNESTFVFNEADVIFFVHVSGAIKLLTWLF